VDRAAIRGLADYVAALGGRLELVADFGGTESSSLAASDTQACLREE